jgi:hypothetical protein
MKQRRITEEEVEYCLANYHTSYADSEGNLIFRAELLGGRHIRVVLKIDSKERKMIITVADEGEKTR